MNHLREKWNARSKLSSSSSDLDATVVSSLSSSSLVGGRPLASAATAAAVSAPSPVATRPPRRAMTAVEAQRFDALASWIQRSGLSLPARQDAQRKGDAFDDIYDSLDGMEAAVKQELAQLLPKWSTESAPTQPRGSSIVDYMVVIGPDMNDLTTHSSWLAQKSVFEATVVFAHPPQSQFNAECIEQFCFPRGVHVGDLSQSAAAEEFFVLVLSGGGDQGQSVQYACCLRTQVEINGHLGGGKHLVIPVCYALVVATPWIPFLHQLLGHLAVRHQQSVREATDTELQTTLVPDSLSQDIDSLMVALSLIDVPEQGQELQFSWTLNCAVNSCKCSCFRPRADCGSPETVALLLDWAMKELLSVLSVERVITAVSLLLAEMKVIIVSKSLPLLSAGTVGLAALLYPLVWAGPLISILPPALHEYLEAPVPLLCGVETLPDNFCVTKGTAILVIEKDEIRLHPDDLVQLGALQLPGSEGLARQLRGFSDQLKVLKTDHHRSVTANFTMRRIRRHLQDLLQLCSRVNPCNVYACMKQEQLSLSETLFLKVFMQSQMYQKYCDDQPSESNVSRSELQMIVPVAKSSEVKEPSQHHVTSSLTDSIRELFLIATTGSSTVVTNQPDFSAATDEPNRSQAEQKKEVFDEHGTDSVDVMSANTRGPFNRCNSYRDTSQDPDNPTIIVLDRSGLEVLQPKSLSVCNTSKNESVAVELEKFIVSTRTVAHAPQTASDSEHKSQSMPTSPEKTLDAELNESQDEAQSSQSCSFPEVLAVPEARKSDSSADLQNCSNEMVSLSPPVRRTERKSVPRCDVSAAARTLSFISATSEISDRCCQEVLKRTQLMMAATVIQRAWRNLMQQSSEVSRRSLSRGISFVSLRGTSEVASPTPTVDVALADLWSGTVLSLVTERGKLVDIQVRLSDDVTSLEWYHRQKRRGSLFLVDLQEVRAYGGDIIIQATGSREYLFTVHSQRANETMIFFRGLHRLATSSPESGLPSPATSAESINPSQQSPPSRTSLLGSPQCEMSATPRDQDVNPTIVDNTTASSVMAFDESIRKGVLVLKHGRMGRPHLKFLSCDDSLQTLSWTDPTVTNAGMTPPTQSGPSLAVRSEKKWIRFDDVVDVLRGKQTRVFQRSTAGRSNAELCLSIVTPTRTLDIEAFSRNDFELLCDGIEQRIPKYRGI